MLNSNLQLYEVAVPGQAGGNQTTFIQFVDNAYLRGTFTKSLEVYTITDVPLSPQGNAVISSDVMKSAFLTLFITDAQTDANGYPVKGQGEYVKNVPLSTLHLLQNSNNDPFERTPFLLEGQIISWDKCYITLSAPLNNTDPTSFLLLVGFDFNPAYKAN